MLNTCSSSLTSQTSPKLAHVGSLNLMREVTKGFALTTHLETRCFTSRPFMGGLTCTGTAVALRCAVNNDLVQIAILADL